MVKSYDNEGQLDRIRLALRRNVADLAYTLLGERNHAASTRFEHRWGSGGGLRVTVSGAKQGSCVDYRSSWKGDPFGLIMRERRCEFPEALAWASSWTGISLDVQAEQPSSWRSRAPSDLDLERERRRAAQEAEETAERARKIAAAQAIWASRLPTLMSTVAEQYIVLRRGIPLRPSDWPDCAGLLPPHMVHWQDGHSSGHPTWQSVRCAGALVLASTTPDGTITAVQRIYLDNTADNIRRGDGSKIKLTAGSFAGIGSAVRLPGSADGPLLLAEGGETGLALLAATGHEVWIALGSIAMLQPPTGRKVVICRDDDKAQSPADKALTRALGNWRNAGITLTVATPWRVRRHDKSDFADVIKIDGPDAVRARIAEALAPTTRTTVARLPATEARPLLQAAIGRFFAAKAAYDPAHGRPPPVHAIRSDLGSGKSDAARRGAVNALIQRALDDTQVVTIALPTHALGEEAAALFEAVTQARENGLSAGIWRGRQAPDPAAPGRAMCLDLDRVHDAMDAGSDVETSCCRSKGVQCLFHTQCGYQAQKVLDQNRIPSLWFIAHESLFHPSPKVVGTVSTLIVDERMYDAGLTGHTGAHKTLTLDALSSCTLTGVDGQRLHYLRSLAFNRLRDEPNGPLSRQTLLKTDLTVENAREAGALEWRLKVDAGIHPGMTVQERKAAVIAAATNRTVRRLAMFWHAVAALLAPDGPEHSGWAALAEIDVKEGPCRVIQLKGRSEIHESWRVPTLVLDATMDIRLLQPYWPNIELTADIAITTPHQHVLQVVDKTYAKGNFDITPDELDKKKVQQRTKHLSELNAAIGGIARAFAPGRTVAVTQLTVSDALPTVGRLPDTVDHAHHNAVAGIDRFKNHAALVAVGRTAPPPAAVERIAEALSGRAVAHLDGWYPKVSTIREMVTGEMIAAEADEHPDPIADAIRWQICEAELLQIIGRVRGVNRTEIDPVTVIVMASTPLPIPITKQLTANDLRPDPIDLQLARGGIAFTNPTHASQAYPDLWPSREGAKSALSRARTSWVQSRIIDSLIRECTQLVANPQSFAYRLAGERQKPAVAWYDPSIIIEPVVTALRDLLHADIIPVDPLTPSQEPTQEAPIPAPDTSEDSVTAMRDPCDFDYGLSPTIYPRAGANRQKIMMMPTDMFIVRFRTGGTILIRRFDGVSIGSTEPATDRMIIATGGAVWPCQGHGEIR